MKKLIAILLAAALLLTMAACSNGGTQSTASSQSPAARESSTAQDSSTEESSTAAEASESSEEESSTPAAKLNTYEQFATSDECEEPAKVTISYPDNFTYGGENPYGGWEELVDKAKDIYIESALGCDYNTYDDNQEYAKEDYFYEEGVFGGYNGFVVMYDEDSASVEVYIYLDCIEELDDVYMMFSIRSASYNEKVNPVDLYRMDEVQQVLNSIVYTAPADAE